MSRDGAARFANQQHSRGHVPGIQAELPEQIQPPAGDISEIDRRRAGAPHAVRKHGELIVEMHVYVLMPLARREARGRQRIFDPRRAGDMNARAVQERAGARFRAEHFIAGGIDDHAADQFARALQRESDVEHRESVSEVGGAVQRIDIPAILGGSRVPAAFLGDDRVRGKVALQALDDQPFAGAVGLGDQIVFALELEAVVVLAAAS